MLPTLSCLSVSVGPGGCLRHRCSSASLRISLLHAEFHPPLPHSSLAVTMAVPRLSPGISPLSYKTACARFTPINSYYRFLLTYYRGSRHEASRCLFLQYRHAAPVLGEAFSFCTKAVYNPKAFVLHAALLDQACAHGPKFPTAASRRSLCRVSVSVWLVVLSDQLQIACLVCLYPTTFLI